MWRYFAFFFCFADALENYYSPYNYCAEVNHQSTVIIPQLMGLWFGVEKIDHQDERHFIRALPSCPIIHISEDHRPTTMNPLYTYTQPSRYGEGHRYSTGTQDRINQELRQRAENERRNYYRNYSGTRFHEKSLNYIPEERFLTIQWDESGDKTMYHVRYNVTKPGFWISSGPENGAVLKDQFSHYAGNIQVLKAVGSHMLLTFCHQMPERQIYSILLSREKKLNPVDIDSVRRLLNRIGLHTNAVEKLCNIGDSGSSLRSSLGSLFITLIVYCILK